VARGVSPAGPTHPKSRPDPSVKGRRQATCEALDRPKGPAVAPSPATPDGRPGCTGVRRTQSP
jgi:hypothetical protein